MRTRRGPSKRACKRPAHADGWLVETHRLRKAKDPSLLSAMARRHLRKPKQHLRGESPEKTGAAGPPARTVRIMSRDNGMKREGSLCRHLGRDNAPDFVPLRTLAPIDAKRCEVISAATRQALPETPSAAR